jgi:NAD(P)-dependent dehydrogenase (short-subunit alcohol dehydrogenase family)
MQALRGRVAVVTGAASGIGRALAERFAAEGMRLVLADVEGPALERAEAELRGGGAEVLALRTDVSKEAEVQALAAAALQRFGTVHVLCNNAGVGSGGRVWELTTADWEWVLGVNLWGVIHGIRAFVPAMLRAGEEGHVVNTASLAGLISAPYVAPYHASKHAVVTISESLHLELALLGARLKVSVLCPGYVATRIADSTRNRPRELRAAVESQGGRPEAAAMNDAIRRRVAAGLPPAEVARQVLEAIREERFWIFTHPAMKTLIEQRHSDVMAERNPGSRPYWTQE